MAILIHEIWAEDVEGQVRHTCCFAGPMGDDCRRTLDASARLLTTFEAYSHFAAMTTYNRLLGREAYTTDQDWDYQTYPNEWLTIQQGHGEPDSAPI